MTSITRKLDRVQLTDTQIKVVMSQRILDQIKYLCRAIPKVEWSGVLFYSTTGSIKDPENLVCTLEDILPMHKGTAGYTEYSFDEKVANYVIDNEIFEKGWKMGHIHSHNSMGVFFSGTDWSELEDNAPNHNIYLSLIVNNWMDFCAKVCFIAEAQESQDFNFVSKDENGEKYIHSTKSYEIEDKQLVSYDCDIDTPDNRITVEEEFKTKVAGIIAAAVPKPVVNSHIRHLGPHTTRYPATGASAQGAKVGFQKDLGGLKNPNEKKEEENDEYPSFDQEALWENAGFSDPSAKTSIQTKHQTQLIRDTIVEGDIEEFSVYVLNLGNDISEYADVEEIVRYYETHNLGGGTLAADILAKYSHLYRDFFIHVKGSSSAETFTDVTEKIIAEYQYEMSYAMTGYTRQLLSPVVESLKRMLDNFNNSK